MPLSVFSLRPSSSKYCITAILSKADSELNINLPFVTMASISSCRSQAFVRLHRPFPVMNNFLPSFSFRSKICTRDPGTDNLAAAIMPAAPPPIITISLIFSFPHRKIQSSFWDPQDLSHRYCTPDIHPRYFPDFPECVPLHPVSSYKELPQEH